MSGILASINQTVEYGKLNKVVHNYTENEQIHGRSVQIQGKHYTNFGSCSYLGLEKHPQLIAGAHDALIRYGTQFSSSRTFLSLGLYENLENYMCQLFGQPAIVAASTTLGHLATLPVIIEEGDAIILDLQVHSSIQMVVKQLKAQKIPVYVIQHNAMDHLESKLKRLRNKHRKIWYLADGIYSMYGDVAPMNTLIQLMDQYKQLHLYIDDAHGMSWTGQNGIGYVRSTIAHHPKMVMATSLNKSFACAGGLLLFPNEKMANKVRNCGSTLIFSGPIQPPMLGAACASAKLHLSNEIQEHQQKLKQLIDYTNEGIKSRDIPQFSPGHSPLFFVPIGNIKLTTNLTNRIMQAGHYLNSAGFPAVPMKRGGLRFMLNNHLNKQDVDALLDAIQYHYPIVLEEEGSSCKKVAKSFQIPEFDLAIADISQNISLQKDELSLEVTSSIKDIAPKLWDQHFANEGSLSYANLKLVEQVFTNNELPENRWDFNYVSVKDQQGNIVLLTFYTTALVKDDMLSPSKTSEIIEAQRAYEPYYLTSKNVMLGSMITKGNALYLNTDHSKWEKALELLLAQMQHTVEEQQASKLLLREFPTEIAQKLHPVLFELGLVKLNLPDIYIMNDLTWKDQTDYLSRLGQKYRYNVRKEIIAFSDQYEVCTDKPTTEKEIRAIYNLYCQVHKNAFELNMFQLPFKYFQQACIHHHYDIIRLYLKDKEGKKGTEPIACMISMLNDKLYAALMVGLDYTYVRSHNSYKQALYQTAQRAKALGCTNLDLAFTAGLEKKKIGARPQQVCAYIQAQEHYSYAVLDSMRHAS